MSEMKSTEKMTFFRSYRDAGRKLKGLSRLAFYEALFDYGLDGIVPTADGPMGMVFVLIKPYLDKSRRLSEQGQKGGSQPRAGGKPPVSQPQANVSQPQATPKPKPTEEEIRSKTEDVRQGTSDVRQETSDVRQETADLLSGNCVAKKSRKSNPLRAKHPTAYDFWERIRKVYPSARRHAPGLRTLRFIEDGKLWEQEEAITKSIVAWSNCDEWKLGYVLRMSRFIEEEHWKEEPPAPKGVETVHRIYTSQAPETKCSEDTDLPTP